GNGRLDEQRSGNDCGSQNHARPDAPGSRKTGRSASCGGEEKRNSAAFADSYANDCSQAQSNSHAQKFFHADRETDAETDAEKERRAENNAEAIKREGRFGKKSSHSEKRIEPSV